MGLIRKPASFMTSICDERGEELLYAGVPITRVLEQGLGVGGVLGLLWFQVDAPLIRFCFKVFFVLLKCYTVAVSDLHSIISSG